MPSSKVNYAKTLLQTPALGSVLLGFVGLVVSAALIVGLGRSGPVAAAHPAAGPDLKVSAPPMAVARELVAAPEIRVRPGPRHAATAAISAPAPRLEPAIFQRPIASDELGFLSDYAGRPANDVVREQKLRNLVSRVVPYAPFHFGLDMPLTTAVEGMMAHSELPVEVRDGRYVMVTGRRSESGTARGRAFLWIDMQEGIAVGGIFFYPSNGEPTPTLTLFSKQVREGSLGMSQFPVAFAEDLSRWAATEGVPPLTTRYFINAENEKVLLAHDEDVCKGAEPGQDSCEKMRADAADIDVQAAHYLEQTQYASNATMRMLVDSGQ